MTSRLGGRTAAGVARFVGVATLTPAPFAADIRVSGTGSDSGFGTFEEPYRTITKAKDEAGTDDVIRC